MKIGDKVKAISDKYFYTNRENKYTGEVVNITGKTIEVKTIAGYDKGVIFSGLNEEDFVVIPEKKTMIHITISDPTITAVLKEGNTVIARSEAKRSPDDVFDAVVGAKLAVDRLFTPKEEKKSWLKAYDDVENHLGISREEWDLLRCKKVRFVKVFDEDSINVSDGDFDWVFLNSSLTGEPLS